MNKEPSWDLYRTFLAVIREGSLSGAARVLGLAQPSVSRHIDTLEEALGTRLFLRTQRGLAPTDAALELQPYAESLALTSAALLRAASGNGGDGITGTVRVSASEVVGVEHLPPILTKLRQRHPGLEVELVLSNTVDDLLRREADVAVRMIEPQQQALVARRCGSIALGFHARADYLARRGTPRTVEDLSGHDLIGFDRETPAIRAYLSRLNLPARPDFALRADSDLAQLAFIRAGFGIGMCQVPLGARDPSLVRVLPDAVSLDLGLWVVMHEDLKTSPRCRAVFDALAEGLSLISG